MVKYIVVRPNVCSSTELCPTAKAITKYVNDNLPCTAVALDTDVSKLLSIIEPLKRIPTLITQGLLQGDDGLQNLILSLTKDWDISIIPFLPEFKKQVRCS